VTQILGVTEPADVFGEGDMTGVRHRAREQLLNRLLAVRQELARDPARAGDPSIRYEMEFGIPELLLKTLVSGRGRDRRPSPRARDHAMRSAVSYIEAFGKEPITVRDLCEATRVSERTLQYAFLECYGVTPKSYLQAIRLHGARRELKQSDPSTTKVTDIAFNCRFWHMGHFAADYRKQFGELPSQTLKARA
jgi:AraC family ethanolamine operon transcriptional activator